MYTNHYSRVNYESFYVCKSTLFATFNAYQYMQNSVHIDKSL